MKVYYLMIVILFSLGVKTYSSKVSLVNRSPTFTWHSEEDFHAHELAIHIYSFNVAEEDDVSNDEDPSIFKCLFSKKEVHFSQVFLIENFISIHPNGRLSKPFLKPQFTPPDYLLIA